MKRYEYQITLHTSDSFRHLVYFCSEDASCKVRKSLSDQINKLESLLNEHGKRGWELAQASFGKDGVVIFWKKIVTD